MSKSVNDHVLNISFNKLIASKVTNPSGIWFLKRNSCLISESVIKIALNKQAIPQTFWLGQWYRKAFISVSLLTVYISKSCMFGKFTLINEVRSFNFKSKLGGANHANESQ